MAAFQLHKSVLLSLPDPFLLPAAQRGMTPQDQRGKASLLWSLTKPIVFPNGSLFMQRDFCYVKIK